MPEVASCTVISGAGGWLGTALTRRLLDDPARQRLKLLVRSIADERALRSALGDRGGVEIVTGDISKADTSRRLLFDVPADTTVVHTAGIIHPSRTRTFFEVNAEGTRHITEAALDAGIAKFVHVSSNSPFGTNPDRLDTFRADEPFNPYLGYGRSKMYGELAVADAVGAGLDAVIVRPPWFYGPFQPLRQTTFFRLVRTGRFPVIGNGDQRRSMVYIDNLIDGVLAAERYRGASGSGFWIADASVYTVNEIVETVGRALTDEGFTVAPPTTRLPALASKVAEVADRVIQRTGMYQQQLHVLGEMGHTIACDITRSTEELGYVPQIELHEGMRRSIRWCREQGIEL